MSPESYRQIYKGLQDRLQQVFQAVNGQNSVSASLQGGLTELQNYFQCQIVALDLDRLDLQQANQVSAHRTEMHKQLRLLKMDAMFLQAARQSATTQQRRQQMLERLQLLLEGCRVILEDFRE